MPGAPSKLETNAGVPSPRKAPGRLRSLALAAAVCLYLLIVVGAIVRVTGSGLGCPDWPLCYGRLLPPLRTDALLEYSHRWTAALASLLVVAMAVQAGRKARQTPWIWVPALLAVVALAFQVSLGAVTVLLETPPPIVAIHMALALIILGLQWVVVVSASAPQAGDRPVRLTLRQPLAAQASATLVVVFILLVSGTVVRGSGASMACAGFPLCDGVLWPGHPLGRVQMLHRGLALVAGLTVWWLAARMWRTRSIGPAARASVSLASVLIVAQAWIGARSVLEGIPPVLTGLHVATAAALWSALVISTSLTARVPGESLEESPEPQASASLAGSMGAYFLLTKPAILLLLLFTTLAGMVVGRGSWPPWSIVVGTMVGGALAAAGASALNQYTDRRTDVLMARTRGRPIPAGLVRPDRALAFGLVLCATGFYVLALGVNWAAAVLALIGMVYYVALYGLVLKRATPQNIVVGGGAGAMPLLVGWAAGTGGLSMQAFLLFFLVFFWTPAHFWALALVRQADYRKAGIPMLPVVAGEPSTRAQIALYSAQVVIITILIGAIAREGWFYFGSAVALGLLLLLHAWRLWKDGSTKRAWRMYRFSSLYLALFFGAIMLNALWR
ncbi:MAG TPA: heme o synthase [Anaerolineales bacterium]|nr:heme o synthase [Anaerolineales bacterium]